MSGTLANAATHNAVMDFGKDSPWTRLAETVRSIWPMKTAINLAHYTGLQVRSCELFLSRNSMLNGDAVVSLLNSEHGHHVALALTENSDAQWRKEFREMYARKQLEAQIAELQGRLAALGGGK